MTEHDVWRRGGFIPEMEPQTSGDKDQIRGEDTGAAGHAGQTVSYYNLYLYHV